MKNETSSPAAQIPRCTRRHVLGALSGAAAAGLLLERGIGREIVTPGRIDVHYHFIPPAWITDPAVLRHMSSQTLDISRRWSPERALEAMSQAGIETVVGSIPPPGIWFGDAKHARRLARRCNEYAAELTRTHSRRFASFAVLPLPDVDGSLDEIRFALDELGADGIGLYTNYDSRYLADPGFAPIFSELNRRKATIFVHPTIASCCVPADGMAPTYVEFPVDTTRVILQWILTKSSELYPNLKLIFSHAGGYIMGGLGRLQFLANMRQDFRLPSDFKQEVGKFYYEISSSADRVTMTALLSYVPVRRVVLGTDSPYVNNMAANIRQLQGLGLRNSDLRAIERGNALRIIPSLARRV